MAAWLGLKKYLWSNTMRVAYRVWPFSEFTSSHQNFTHSLGWISKFINGNRWRQWFKWWVWFPGKIISTLVRNFTSGRGIAIAIIISLNAFTFLFRQISLTLWCISDPCEIFIPGRWFGVFDTFNSSVLWSIKRIWIPGWQCAAVNDLTIKLNS